MSKGGIVYLLTILNVNTYANVILERSLCANEGHIGLNENTLGDFRFEYEYEIEYENDFSILVFRLHIIITHTHFIP